MSNAVTEINGEAVTLLEAARTINDAGGPFAVVVYIDRDGGPEVTVYARYHEGGAMRAPELVPWPFDAATAQDELEHAAVIGAARDLIVLADRLAADTAPIATA